MQEPTATSAAIESTDTQSQARVLILGVDHPRDAAAIRSLGRAGIPVDVATHFRTPSSMWSGSRYIRNRYLLDERDDRSVERLEELGAEGGGGLLIPTNDHYLLLVARHHARLARHFTLVVPPWSVLESLMDKLSCHALARAAGLETPEHFAPATAEELDAAVAKLDFERSAYLLKIRLWDSGPADFATDRRVTPAGNSRETVRRRCREIAAKNGAYPILEEVVEGEADRCIGVSLVIGRDGEPVVSYCVRRLKLFPYARGDEKHPYELGANAYCESIHDEEAVAAALRLVRQTGFYGAITVELKRDLRDDRLRLIKADPRFVRATSLSTALGLDLPIALYDSFSGSTPPCRKSQRYRAGVGWMWLEAYLMALWKNRRSRSLPIELVKMVRNLSRVRAFAYLDLRDPLPCLLLWWTARRRLRALRARAAGQVARPVAG